MTAARSRVRRACVLTFAASALFGAAPASAQPATWTTPRGVAVLRTNAARATLALAVEAPDLRKQREVLRRAEAEYALAADAWLLAVQKDNGGPAPRDGLFWLADARRHRLRIQAVQVGEDTAAVAPTRGDINEALAASVAALATRGCDNVGQAAFFVVDLIDLDRDMAFLRNERTHGASGVPKRKEVQFDSNDLMTRNVVSAPMPGVVQNAILARDLYVARVPPAEDLLQVAPAYRYYGGEQHVLYGHFDEARRRLQPLWTERCGKDEYGYKAWEQLMVMANLERDVAKARALAEAEQKTSCAIGGAAPPPVGDPVYVDARRKFAAAQKANGSERAKLWLEAAALYELAFDTAPARREAVEGAFNAAYAYKQIGNHEKPTVLYAKLVAEYGSEERLQKLQLGDPSNRIAPSLQEYAERAKYTLEAMELLATSFYSRFDYGRAAETYTRVASNVRFSSDRRRQASTNALILFANLGWRTELVGARSLLMHDNPSEEERLAADYVVAGYDYERAARDPAVAREVSRALSGFFHAYERTGDRRVVEAAYRLAKLAPKTGAGAASVWFRRVVASWERATAKDTAHRDMTRAPWVDYAAMAQLALVDDDVRAAVESRAPAARNRDAAMRLDSALRTIAALYPGSDVTQDIARSRAHLQLVMTLHGDAKARAYVNAMPNLLELGRPVAVGTHDIRLAPLPP